MERLSPSTRRLVAAVTVAVVTMACASTLEMLVRTYGIGIDFIPLRHAARAVVESRSIYSDPAFVYPPPAAVFLAPLALGSDEQAWVLWLAATLLALGVATLGITRAATDHRGILGASAVMVFVGGCAAGESLWLGNMSVVLVPVAVIASMAFRRGRWAAGCWLLTASLLLKPLLVPLLVVPALRHRFRALAAPAVAAVVTLLVCSRYVPGAGSFTRVIRYCLGPICTETTSSTTFPSRVGSRLTTHHDRSLTPRRRWS